jgi:hypothetical protein
MRVRPATTAEVTCPIYVTGDDRHRLDGHDDGIDCRS